MTRNYRRSSHPSEFWNTSKDGPALVAAPLNRHLAEACTQGAALHFFIHTVTNKADAMADPPAKTEDAKPAVPPANMASDPEEDDLSDLDGSSFIPPQLASSDRSP